MCHEEIGSSVVCQQVIGSSVVCQEEIRVKCRVSGGDRE